MSGLEDQFKPLEHDMLRLSPNDYITFPRGGDNNESRVDITCSSKFPVTYKIQTTSPEKFRVRPRCGVLSPGETVAVNILLKPEHNLSEASKDKFLVMCIPVPTGIDLQSPMTEVWKQKPTNNPDVEQHRLTCIHKGAETRCVNSSPGGGESVDNVPTKDLSQHAIHLERQLRNTQILQWVTLVFLLILSAAVVYLLKLQMGSTVVAVEEGEAEEYTCAGGKI